MQGPHLRGRQVREHGAAARREVGGEAYPDVGHEGQRGARLLLEQVDRLGALQDPELRETIRREKHQGYAEEDGQVTEGYASVAACVFDHGSRPIAAVALTFADTADARHRARLGGAASAAADALTGRISGRRPAQTQ